MISFEKTIWRKGVLYFLSLFFSALLLSQESLADTIARLDADPLYLQLQSDETDYTVTLHLDAEGEIPYGTTKAFALSDPNRIVIELPLLIADARATTSVDDGEIAGLTISRYQATTRVTVQCRDYIPPFQLLPGVTGSTIKLKISKLGRQSADYADKINTQNQSFDIAFVPENSILFDTTSIPIEISASPKLPSRNGAPPQQIDNFGLPKPIAIPQNNATLPQQNASTATVSSNSATIPTPGTLTKSNSSSSISRQGASLPSVFDDTSFLLRHKQRVPALTVHDDEVKIVGISGAKTISRISTDAAITREVTPPPILKNAMKGWGNTAAEHAAQSHSESEHSSSSVPTSLASSAPTESQGIEDSSSSSAVSQNSLVPETQIPEDLPSNEADDIAPLEPEDITPEEQEQPPPSAASPTVTSLLQWGADRTTPYLRLLTIGSAIIGGMILLIIVLWTRRLSAAPSNKKRRYRSSATDISIPLFKPVTLEKNHLVIYYQVLNLSEHATDDELERRYVEELEQCEEDLRRFGEAFPERTRKVRQRLETVREAYRTLRQARDGMP